MYLATVVTFDKCVYIVFWAGVHREEKIIGYYDVYQKGWHSNVKTWYLANYCTYSHFDTRCCANL